MNGKGTWISWHEVGLSQSTSSHVLAIVNSCWSGRRFTGAEKMFRIPRQSVHRISGETKFDVGAATAVSVRLLLAGGE